MKTFLKITISIIAIVFVMLFTLPFLFMDKIEALVKEEGNKMLNAEFDFKDFDISLIKDFPLASISLEGFYLKGVGVFESDTLVKAKEISAAMNLMSLFGDEGYDIRRITLDGLSAKAIIMPDGAVNWDVMKESSEDTDTVVTDTAASPFRIKLELLQVKNMNVVYDDRQGSMYAAIEGLDATCSGDFGDEKSLLGLVAKINSLTYSMDGIPYLNKATISADMNIDADFVTNKYTLKENCLQLNAIKAGIDGWVALNEDESMEMDIKLNSNEIGFKEILSLIPAIYAKDFEDLKTDGKAALTAYAKGCLVGDSILPEFNVAIDVANAMFHYPDLPAGVDRINISAKVSNPGGSADNTEIRINPLNFVMAGNPFSVVVTMSTPVSDMAFNATAKGKLDLGKIKDIYPMEEELNLNGVVDADIQIDGRMSSIEKEQYDKVKASGSIRLNNMLLELEDMPAVNITKSLFTFTPRYLQLSETTVNIGDNDITLDSKFENYMAYAFKGKTLKGSLNVKSNRFNLNDFMTDSIAETEPATESETTPADTAAMGVIEIPENIDFNMQATFKEVLFDNMKLSNVKGVLVAKDRKVDMKNLSFETMGGNVVVNGCYSTPLNEQPAFKGSFSLNNIGFAQAYNDLNMVRNLAPVFSNLTGDFSGSINIDTKLDETMSPVIPSLTGSGTLKTKDLSLANVGIIQTIADITQKPSLKEAKAKDINIEFTIKDGRVNTKPFDINIGDCKMNLSGSTGLDQTIDYKGEITIPTSAGKLAKLGTVDMNIGGTFTSPKVSIDMASLAKKAAASVAEEALNKFLGIGSSQTTEEESSDESTPTSTPVTKEEVTKQILNTALDLFKKKK